MKSTDYPRLEISREALHYNISHFRSKLKPETKMLVLLKANAYGAGSLEIAHMMENEQVDYIGVAFVNEAIELRSSGITLPILVLNWSRGEAVDMINFNLEPSITDMNAFRVFLQAAQQKETKQFPVHIKLDTGMHRSGFMENELDELETALASQDSLSVKAVFSHLAGADEDRFDGFTLEQARLFDRMSNHIAKSLGRMPMRHLLNTAGIERFAEKYPEYQYDMVRLGIGLHGLQTMPGEDLKPLASLKTTVVQIKHLDVSDGTVGYSRHGRITGPTTVATIPLGYADGINRRLGNGAARFMVRGTLVPTLGNICMDACMLNVTGVDVRVGDEVTIFGEQPRLEILSDILETIPYEVLTSMSHRINRVVVD